MAIKIRCPGCRKKISIDEAFSGGVCRCPYCGATSHVPTSAGGNRAASRPDRPDRPDVPGAPAPAPTAAGGTEASVPTARPVLVQGVVAIVLAVLLVAMLAGAGVVLAMAAMGPDRPEPDTAPPTPMVGVSGSIAGMDVKPPVVLLIDGAQADVADMGTAMARHYVRTARPADRFNFLFIREEATDALSDQWVPGGDEGDAKVKAFMAARVGGGATPLAPALDKAIAMKPDSIVLFSAKGPADPGPIADRLRQAGIRFLGVNIGGYEPGGGTMKDLADATGGKVRQFSLSEIQQYITDAAPLP